ncbi:hypothetical protein CEXT_445961 [Caerostris extrusa]|uniref:Uncharacterized protein n=1 Tax=Caerostris extrusa TaxID=172846 RepID=A0AAV4USR4_CAEEX|nr:hypothetical protein CEXT_445961 [Caerostris extrusa]
MANVIIIDHNYYTSIKSIKFLLHLRETASNAGCRTLKAVNVKGSIRMQCKKIRHKLLLCRYGSNSEGEYRGEQHVLKQREGDRKCRVRESRQNVECLSGTREMRRSFLPPSLPRAKSSDGREKIPGHLGVAVMNERRRDFSSCEWGKKALKKSTVRCECPLVRKNPLNLPLKADGGRGVTYSQGFSHRPSVARDRVTLLLVAGRRFFYLLTYLRKFIRETCILPSYPPSLFGEL